MVTDFAALSFRRHLSRNYVRCCKGSMGYGEARFSLILLALLKPPEWP